MANGAVLSAREARVEEGHKFEEKFFGFSPIFDPNKIHRRSEKISFGEILNETLQQQEIMQWKPRKPRTWLAKKLFDAVKMRLPKYVRNELLLCCALGTPMDYIGVDGFFVLECHPHFVVTFDLTRCGCPQKQVSLRANGLITINDMYRNERINHIASIIAKSLIGALRHRWRSNKKRLWW